MPAASDSDWRLWHLGVLNVAELTKALLAFYRSWARTVCHRIYSTVFVSAHRQRIAFLLYRLLLDIILIK